MIGRNKLYRKRRNHSKENNIFQKTFNFIGSLLCLCITTKCQPKEEEEEEEKNKGEEVVVPCGNSEGDGFSYFKVNFHITWKQNRTNIYI